MEELVELVEELVELDVEELVLDEVDELVELEVVDVELKPCSTP